MSKVQKWLDKWIDEHDLGGITVGQIKAEFAAEEQRSELHANINQAVSDALGQSAGTSWHDLGEKVAEVVRQRNRLGRYCQHDDTCMRRQIGTVSGDPSCSCGLDALLANAKEGKGDPLMVHQLEQVRRNWRHWQQRAEIAEERLAERPAPAAPDALRALAQEVWDSVPADYSGPMVERHAAALNALGAALAPRKEGEG